MALRTFHYRWVWDLRSAPEALWPLAADTNRFNRDAGIPFVKRLEGPSAVEARSRGNQLLRLTRWGMSTEWEEHPFEWVRPHRFGVIRQYRFGPLEELRALTELHAAPGGGTRLIYEVTATPRTRFGSALIPILVGNISRRSFEKVFREYDRLLIEGRPRSPSAGVARVQFAPGGAARLESACQATRVQGADPEIVERLRMLIEHADDMFVSKVRPYALADEWGLPRRSVLECCLRATRAGMLEFRWDVLCPLCRGTKRSEPTLSAVNPRVHCDACLIDFDINFDQLVELTFRPSPSIRLHSDVEYCIGGPRVTPHIVVQQRIDTSGPRECSVHLEPGRYRVRTRELRGSQAICVADDGIPSATVIASSEGWPREELRIRPQSTLRFDNRTARDQLVMVERMEWTDQATTAADVIAMPLFRDLFSEEALRPGETVSVGRLCILFTDLSDSTRLYQAIGDAPAFGRVMSHFDILGDAINANEGAVVKTIGDAVMATFPRPACAVRAVHRANRRLREAGAADHPLVLKAGIHFGPCIAVTLNGRLDYFGTTVNLAARLQTMSRGGDLIMSEAARTDPEVAPLLLESMAPEPIDTVLQGFDDQRFRIWRLVFPESGPNSSQVDVGQPIGSAG